jgi:predicted Zn-dependent protease with MMP-like domain
MHWKHIQKLAEREVEETVRELPPEVRGRLSEVPVIIEGMPTPDDIAVGIEADTLGYFDEDAAGLVRIRLWIENIWDFAEGDEDIFLDEVRTTLLHEIGHLLGWDEEDVEERGLG